MSKANYKFDSCACVYIVRIDACECECECECVCVLGLGVYTLLKKVKKVNLKKCPGLVHTYYLYRVVVYPIQDLSVVYMYLFTFN